MPDSASVALPVAMKLPDLPLCGSMNTLVPFTNVLPLADESVTVGALGAVVSTFTVVETDAVLSTLSVPVSVYR